MALDRDTSVELVLESGDEWQSWRALRLLGESAGEVPRPTDQDDVGAFLGQTGRASPGATGEALCHLRTIELQGSAPFAIAADWLEEARTPALAWLDAPDDVPGELDEHAGGRVWATASASCGLLLAGRAPGPRAFELLRGESDQNGRFTGGAYPTFAAAGAFRLAEGPQSETAEWALRWAREHEDAEWGPWERVTGLTFWVAAGIPVDHSSVESFAESLREDAPPGGWSDDVELTLRALELLHRLED